MRNKIKQLILFVREYVKSFPEILGVPLALFGFWFVPRFIRLFDPSAGEVDTGILQLFLLAVCWVLLINALVFLGLKFNFPKLYQCYKEEFPDPSSFWRFFAVYALLTLSFSLALVAIA